MKRGYVIFGVMFLLMVSMVFAVETTITVKTEMDRNVAISVLGDNDNIISEFRNESDENGEYIVDLSTSESIVDVVVIVRKNGKFEYGGPQRYDNQRTSVPIVINLKEVVEEVVEDLVTVNQPFGTTQEFKITSNYISFVLRNGGGSSADISSISVIGCGSNVTAMTLADGSSSLIRVPCSTTLVSNDKFKGDVAITYRIGDKVLDLTATGSISGVVESKEVVEEEVGVVVAPEPVVEPAPEETEAVEEKEQSKIAGMIVGGGKSVITSKITYYIVGGVVVIGLFFFLILIAKKKLDKKKPFKITNIKNFNEEKYDASLEDAEKKLNEAKEELDELKNRKRKLAEAREKFKRDQEELRKIEGEY